MFHTSIFKFSLNPGLFNYSLKYHTRKLFEKLWQALYNWYLKFMTSSLIKIVGSTDLKYNKF